MPESKAKKEEKRRNFGRHDLESTAPYSKAFAL
jgi:hypothetical protein